MEELIKKELIRKALEARKMSYSPYSGFAVGAALMDSEGDIYTGCNIENASYPATVCAERTAFFKAVSDGVREFKMIAIVGGCTEHLEEYAFPCGICRQVMSEFCSGDFEVIAAKNTDDYKCFKLKELLPHSFGTESLQ